MPYDDAVTAEAVDAYLTSHPGITVVSVVHSETPSGTLNPVWDIGPVARRHGAVTVVDAVSSFAGIELRPDEWQLDLIVAGPQKCLGGPPGMSLMALNERAWAAIDANPDAPRDSFLSITDWRDKWHGQGRFPYTPSVSDLHGVDAAADELLAEGLDGVDRPAPARVRRLLGRRGGDGPAAVAGQQGDRVGLRVRRSASPMA